MILVYSLLEQHPAAQVCEGLIRSTQGLFTTSVNLLEVTAVLNKVYKLEHTDRSLLVALMSSHVHLALLAGEAPAWRLLKPLHTSMAKWLNRVHHSFGPVFAERATTILVPPARTGVRSE